MKLCELCNTEHNEHQAHRFATNTVANTVANRPSVANTVANKHRGSTFSDFLKEEGIEKVVTAVAVKRYQKWRADNPELYKERQRAYMKKSRAA